MTTDPLPVEQALLPCPFCGQQDNDIVDDRWMCNCCMAEGPPSRVNPDAAWNRRATRSQHDREAIARVILAELERQQSIGAGDVAVHDETGLMITNMDIDLGSLAHAVLASGLL